MSLKRIFLLSCFVFAIHCIANGAVPKVRFYPLTELTFCKGCFGHFGADGWSFKYKLENLSAKDIIVYGHQFEGDKNFTFTYQIQYKNPDICEWQYSYGSSDKRSGWNGISDFFKSKIILKSGQSIQTSGGAFEDNKIPERYTAYIAENANEEPHEIFSEPYLLIKSSNDKKTRTEKAIPILKIVDEECTPRCKLSAHDSPVIRGLRLGTSLEEFMRKFPTAKVAKLHADKYKYKYVWIWDFNEDAFSTRVNFLDDKVARLEVQFKSLKDTRIRADFFQLVSEKIQMPYYWEPYQTQWECKDFLVEVLTNVDPTISVSTKEFLRVRDQINEDELKKIK